MRYHTRPEIGYASTRFDRGGALLFFGLVLIVALILLWIRFLGEREFLESERKQE